MTTVRWKKGRYQVTRFCCTSGLCHECHKRGNHGDKAKRKRVIQTDHVAKSWALHVSKGWERYEPVIERMPFRTITKVTLPQREQALNK